MAALCQTSLYKRQFGARPNIMSQKHRGSWTWSLSHMMLMKGEIFLIGIELSHTWLL
jgi:hypothetical protein